MKTLFLSVVMVSVCLIGYAEEQQDADIDVGQCIVWYNRGLHKMDNPEGEFKNAIRAYSQFAPPYYWLAYYYCKVKRTKESIEYFERYLQVVDKSDPQEKSRIKTAEHFIKEMKAGDVDYNSIVTKAMSKE